MGKTKKRIRYLLVFAAMLASVLCFSASASAASERLSAAEMKLTAGNKVKLYAYGGEVEYWGSYDWKTVGLASRTSSSTTVVPYKNGTTTIYAKFTDGKTLRCRMNVGNVQTTIEKDVTVVVGGYEEIHLPGNAKNLTWDSSDWSICSMNNRKLTSARVYGQKPGTVRIKLHYKDGADVDACLVHVIPKPVFDKISVKVDSGSGFTVRLQGNSQPVEWSTSDPHIKIQQYSNSSATFSTSGRGKGKVYASIQHTKVECSVSVEKRIRICVVDNNWNDCGYLVNYFNNLSIPTDFVYSTYIDLDKYDALIVPGGCDIHASWWGEAQDPRAMDLDWYKDKLQLDMIKKFYAAKKPIFGICRGEQLVNIALGGTLYQHVPGHRLNANKYTLVTAPGLMKDVYGNSAYTWQYHHQAVKKLGSGLRVTMKDPDGTIEAIEHETLPIYGTQWHPESTGDEGWRLYIAFFKIVKKYNSFG